MELNPSDAGFQDRYIVQEIIKEMAKNRPIDTKGKKGFKGNSAIALCEFLLLCAHISRFVSSCGWYTRISIHILMLVTLEEMVVSCKGRSCKFISM